MILLDLHKAFDTIDHSILLMKMVTLALDHSIFRWFKAYLTDRQQLVDFAGIFDRRGVFLLFCLK
jgi:hypothetical protein